MNRIFILKTLILLLSVNAFGQLRYDNYDNAISFSYIYPLIDSLKAENKINTLQLPAFNNDSLFWVNNIKYLNPENERRNPNLTRVGGFAKDTIINFFQVATKIKIKEGNIWLYKITSPTAFGLGVFLNNLDFKTGDYLCAHSNFHDSTGGPYLFRQPEVHTGNFVEKTAKALPIIHKRGFPLNIFGNEMYIEVFSPGESILESGLTITNWSYDYPTNYNLSDAPDWVRKRYPEIDFDYYKR
jgi:hypothetical protein